MKPIIVYGILIVAILISSLVLFLLSGLALIFLTNYSQATFYTSEAAVLFSGDNYSDMIGSPWIFDANTSRLIPNTAIRELIETDIFTEIQNYSFIQGFSVEYENIYNIFNDTKQFAHNSPNFDPLYSWITFHYNLSSNVDTFSKDWNEIIAPLLETTMKNKWYIQKFEFLIAVTA